MTNRRRVTWAGLILLIFALGLVGAAYRSGRLSTAWEDHVLGVPRVDAPAMIEVEATEFGEVAESKFALTNRGKRPLVLTDFRSACVCDGVEVKEGERYVRFTALTLEPGRTAEMRLGQRIRGEIGREMRSSVTFLTNDPACPEAAITFRIPTVTGGVALSRQSVEFGTLRVGETIETSVDVFDRSGHGRRVEALTSSIPDLVRVRFVSAAECLNPPTGSDAAGFVGRIQLTAGSKLPASFDGTVKLFLESRSARPDELAVHGRAAAAVELAPTVIDLPRQSAGGALYKWACVCNSPFGMPFSITVRDCPPVLTVAVDRTNTASWHTVSVSVPDPQSLPPKDGGHTYQISCVAHFEGQAFDFVIPVTIQNGLVK